MTSFLVKAVMMPFMAVAALIKSSEEKVTTTSMVKKAMTSLMAAKVTTLSLITMVLIPSKAATAMTPLQAEVRSKVAKAMTSFMH